MATANKTVLYPVHTSLGATMGGFCGWDMSLWYPTGAVKEHLAVLSGAGLFDTSHMGVILAEGQGLRLFINRAVTKDISDLKIGRAGYAIVLDENGYTVDDTIVYPLYEGAPADRFALVVNAGNTQPVIAHLKQLPGGSDIKWTDLAGELSKFDLQGPASFKIMKTLVANPESVFDSLPYFSFKGEFDLSLSKVKLTDGTPILLSRTGYTGELGFEIFLPNDRAVPVWEALLEAGKPFGTIPCGLAARDSLRAGAVLPLSHKDIGAWPFINNPWPFALPYAADGTFTKDFHGKDALLKAAGTADYTLPFIGFDPRKVDEHSGKVLQGDREIGIVLSAVADMSLGRVEGQVFGLGSPEKPAGFNPKGLVCGFVKVAENLPVGTVVSIKDDRRALKIEIVGDIRPGRTARWPLKKAGA
ncbi:MAG: aminomethyltransferase family protein [Deltaproteobacteria bacterium]|jgi:aminomethyltransferase|nr:aminomethyltransferase family protein [Deltaproteobacteria bacterium]